MANDPFYDRLRAAEIERAKVKRASCHCCEVAVGGQHAEDCIYFTSMPHRNIVDGKESPWSLSG